MRNIIIAASMALSATLFTSCADDKSKKKESDEISVGEVPAAVISAFKAKFNDATDVKWENAHENGKVSYKAKFRSGGTDHKAEFYADGTLAKDEVDRS